MALRALVLFLVYTWTHAQIHAHTHARTHTHKQDVSVPDALTKHMRALYAKYSRDARATDGNTVRSFKAKWGLLGDRWMFFANLTSLSRSESVLSATLHFFVGNTSLRRRRIPLNVWSYGSAGHQLNHVRLTVAPGRKGAWQWRDITALVNQVKGREQLLIGAEMWASQSESPYVLLYANDTAIAESEALQRHHVTTPESEALQRHHVTTPESEALQRHHVTTPESEALQRHHVTTPESEALQRHHVTTPESEALQRHHVTTPESEALQRHHVTTPESEALQRHHVTTPESEALHQNTSAAKPQRHKRSLSLQNNELPEDPRGEGPEYPRGEGPEYPRGEGPEYPRGEGPEYPRGEGRKGRKSSRQKSSAVGGQEGALLRFDARTLKKARRKWAEPRSCARRPLQVDFADIGWSDWILSPENYQAFYCRGDCHFPISKALKPSNHATIQSIMWAVGVVSGVPAPCCVPDKMAALSILFFDEQANVVLKVYPNMIVESCACH